MMSDAPEEFFPQQRACAGALASVIDSFAEALTERGYAWSTTREQVRLVGGLGRWLDRRKLSVRDLDETRIAAFLRDRRKRGRTARSNHATLRSLLDHLRSIGVVRRSRAARRVGMSDQIKRAFAQYLAQERGVCTATQVNYLVEVQALLSWRARRGVLHLASLRQRDVIAFLLDRARHVGPSRAKLAVSALRSFLRWLYVKGKIAVDLAQSVPAVADWRFATLPKSLPPHDVEALLASCDRSSPTGLRNYAILLLLARLGLRAGEIVKLELGDIDWEVGEVFVRGKGGRRDRLPLPKEVGAALAIYLRHGRPACGSQRVFLRARAPLRGFANSIAISTIVARALARAGLHPPRTGAHVLRHALACTMLNGGASLAEIGEVLRHRSPDTTAIYAKVDLVALRELAPAWPGEER